jgi:hypothetical protein
MRFQGIAPATESCQANKSSRGMVGPRELGTSRYAVGLAIPYPVARLQSRTPLHQAVAQANLPGPLQRLHAARNRMRLRSSSATDYPATPRDGVELQVL